MRGHWSAVVVGVVVGCLVAGCSGRAGEHGGVPATTTGTSAVSTTAGAPTSTTATTTAQAPLTSAPQVDLPPAATAHTEEGAKAFVRHYFAVLALAGTTTETASIRALTSDDCSGCRRVYSSLDAMHALGQRYDVASIVVLTTVLKPGSTASRPIVLMQGKELPSKLISTDGSTIQSFNGGALLFETTLVWTDKGWRVTDLVTR